MFEEPYVHYYDSLSFEPDSILQIYRLVPVERRDTIFDRLVMVVLSDSTDVAPVDTADVPEVELSKDTLVVATVAEDDPVEKQDTVVSNDTLRIKRRFIQRFKKNLVMEQER